MGTDETLRLVKWGMGLGPVVVFGLFVTGTLFFDVTLTIGRLLALVGTGISAVGGVVQLLRARRSTATPLEGPLAGTIHLSTMGGVVVWNAAEVDHAGFRGMFIVCGAGLIFIGGLLVLATLLGPDRVAWLDESNGELE